MKTLWHTIWVIVLTALTQLGGVAWVASRFAPKYRYAAFFACYAALSLSAVVVAPIFLRVPLNCTSNGHGAGTSPFYCLLNRHYVSPELKTVLTDLADEMHASDPSTQIRILDAGFPFLNGFPLLPHLSHDDGDKADIALFYLDEAGRHLPGKTPSPIGYFAFEAGQSQCKDQWPTLRWDLEWLQPLWPNWTLDEPRTRQALTFLTDDDRVGRIFVEPHLKDRLRLKSSKVRFQGCRAARHDDHIHIEL